MEPKRGSVARWLARKLPHSKLLAVTQTPGLPYEFQNVCSGDVLEKLGRMLGCLEVSYGSYGSK